MGVSRGEGKQGFRVYLHTGLWEFPGGKVNKGLGCTYTPGCGSNLGGKVVNNSFFSVASSVTVMLCIGSISASNNPSASCALLHYLRPTRPFSRFKCVLCIISVRRAPFSTHIPSRFCLLLVSMRTVHRNCLFLCLQFPCRLFFLVYSIYQHPT